MYYIMHGIKDHMLAAQPPQQVKNILELLPDWAQNSEDLQKLQLQLLEEVQKSYCFSLRKSIGETSWFTLTGS